MNLSSLTAAAVIAAAILSGTAVQADAATEAPTSGPRLTAAPPCEYEDGSSQRVCVWDARHAGNGIGDSFVIRRGGTDRATIRYVSHRRAHDLIREYRATR